MNVHYTFSRSLSLRYIYIYTSHIIFVTSCWKGERSSMTIRRKSYKLGLFPIFSSQLDLLLEVLPVNWAPWRGVAVLMPTVLMGLRSSPDRKLGLWLVRSWLCQMIQSDPFWWTCTLFRSLFSLKGSVWFSPFLTAVCSIFPRILIWFPWDSGDLSDHLDKFTCWGPPRQHVQDFGEDRLGYQHDIPTSLPSLCFFVFLVGFVLFPLTSLPFLFL